MSNPLAALTGHSKHCDLVDTTHIVVGDQNDAFGDAILDFLRRTHRKEIAT